MSKRHAGYASVRMQLHALFISTAVLAAGPVVAAELKVMTMGLGSGKIEAPAAKIDCGSNCDATATGKVKLEAKAGGRSVFKRWLGDCSTEKSATCTLTMDGDRSARAVFDLKPAIPPLTGFTPKEIQAYLDKTRQETSTSAAVKTPARFLAALPDDYKKNWILMVRSESLQTGTARYPRILLPSPDGRFVFTIGTVPHDSYPGSHQNAVEYMQWDANEANFRFHEIVLDTIKAYQIDVTPANSTVSKKQTIIPERTRKISADDAKCSKCHSTQNVTSGKGQRGTDGLPRGTVEVKSKPNWDTYDSWGGMLAFNRDRIYQGSVEAAAFRELFDPWTWRKDPEVRAILEQLDLQPFEKVCKQPITTDCTPQGDLITRVPGGANEGRIRFAFDGAMKPGDPEPPPKGVATINTAYSFDGLAGKKKDETEVQRGGASVTLRHSRVPATSDEGRGVRLFDALGGLAGQLNQRRVADELKSHRLATGRVPIDVRPIALAIAEGFVNVADTTSGKKIQASASGFTVGGSFFDARNGMSIGKLVADTKDRATLLTLRKAEIEKTTLARAGDAYLKKADGKKVTGNGLIRQYGSATSAKLDDSLKRLRQEVFRRPIDQPGPDQTVMGKIYVDREEYAAARPKQALIAPSVGGFNTDRVALYRYFLEPLGVAVDKWSMGVRGRSRTYTFADVFKGDNYVETLVDELRKDLAADPPPSLRKKKKTFKIPYTASDLLELASNELSAANLPAADAVPTYADVQRIFNKSCIECHNGFEYPPYTRDYVGYAQPLNNQARLLDLSEDEYPAKGNRMVRSRRNLSDFGLVTPKRTTSYLYKRITKGEEDCTKPLGLMPCGGPKLSQADIETIGRWLEGAPAGNSGDPHITTIDEVSFDFQAAGEFVLSRTVDLEIQVRQQAVETAAPMGPNRYTGLTTCASVNSAVALRVGDQRITYQPDLSGKPSPDGLRLQVDGEPTKLTDKGIRLEAPGASIKRTSARGGIQINAPGGTVIVITPGWWAARKLWYLNIDTRHLRGTEGLMGAIAPGNWLPALPDGRFPGPMPGPRTLRYKQLYEEFGKAWRVNGTSSLFDYAKGTSTGSFTVEDWPIGEKPDSCFLLVGGEIEAPKEATLRTLSPQEAKSYCSDLVDANRTINCEQDVMVTGDPGFAATYLAAEKILSNAMPTPPVLVSPADNVIGLAQPVTFSWEPSTDLNGDPITYRHYLWPAGAVADTNDAQPAPFWSTPRGGGIARALLALLLGCLLLAALLAAGLKRRPVLMVLVALVILLAASLAYRHRASGTFTKEVAELEPGRIYYWKVIAEDTNGGSVESETRAFETR